tara:strand:- start:49 stop:237 length:189 start_codon:yes stop_codon:yes gene_type:complete
VRGINNMKKDIAYILVIITLLAFMYVQYSHYQNDSYTRVMDCFRDEVKEPEFCQKFYKSYRE